MPFRIAAEEIAALAPPQFVDFMAHLLQAERERLGMPPDAVIAPASLVMTVSDGGIDALAEGAPAGFQSWVPVEGSVWQFKAADISPSQVEAELSKPDVEQELQAGKCWCLTLGAGLTATTRRNREQRATQWFRGRNLPPRFRILDAGQIAGWASAHPSVAMLSVFGRPAVGGLHRFDAPATFVNHATAFAPDQRRERAMDQIRTWLAGPPTHEPVRIEGAAGVGKSRLALEAVRGSGWEQRALYCPDPAGAELGNVLQWVRAHLPSTLLLIVDECDQRLAEDLSRYVADAPDRIRLLTIGTDTTSMYTRAIPPNVITLETLDDEAMRALLKAAHPELDLQACDFVTSMCGGYVKLAVNLAQAIMRTGDQARSAGELARGYTVEHILDVFAPDGEDRRAMEGLSLLQRVGILDEVAAEGEAVAEFMGLQLADLRDAPRRRNTKPFVATAGRYRYITPRLLAVWLADDVWRRRGRDMMSLLRDLPTATSKRSFLDRVLDIGDERRGSSFAASLLGPQGPYTDLSALAEPQLGQLIQVLIQLAPLDGVSAPSASWTISRATVYSSSQRGADTSFTRFSVQPGTRSVSRGRRACCWLWGKPRTRNGRIMRPASGHLCS